MMCGPGYLLGEILKKRIDLALTGVDIDAPSLAYARSRYWGFWHIAFEKGNVLAWQSAAPFDVVLCTGALHHVPYDLQDFAIENIAKMVKQGGFAVISDCYVGYFVEEKTRRRRALKLGDKYMEFVLAQANVPIEVIEETLQILLDDVAGKENKDSFLNREAMLKRHFRKVVTVKTWPNKKLGGYGDYIHFCSKQ
jgi:2-polyprenyl-3-methyl-5-hydroxy-6-metoxy-1,4-benzoquinol methylase